MFGKLRHIALCLSVLLVFAACGEEENVLPAEGERTIRLDLGIAMTRAAEDEQDAYGQAADLTLWLFDQDGNLLQRIYRVDPQFSGRDITGEPVETITTEFSVTGVTQLQFRVLLNTGGLLDGSGNPLTLGDETTMQQIDDAAFRFGATMPQGDNKVPMYGTCDPVPVTASRDYQAEIPLKRAVGKLELFFTKEQESAYLKVNSIRLEHIPGKGYLYEGATKEGMTYDGVADNILPQETPVETFLPADVEQGDFSSYESDHFTPLTLSYTYLLENPNGGTWTDTGNDNDYTYTDPDYDPEKQTDGDYTDGSTRYKMTVAYQTSEGGPEKTQVVYLPAIERNVWNKVFARVKGGVLQIQYKALPWNTVNTSIGYAPQHIPTNHNPFASEADSDVPWANSTVANGNYYALFPIMNYNSSRNTTTKLMDYMYDYPDDGDNEARLCILTRPTYDDQIDDNLHWALKAGSAGARYMFILTGPEGATWEAHLSNEEDFSFSTTKEDDFDNSEYESEGEVYKVTHGIARQKPYIIQVIADHLYTGYEKDLSGNTTEGSDYDGDGYDQYSGSSYNSADEWKFLFGDEYLTEWGKQKWDNREVVETTLYITVHLTDGTEYELTINPSYADSPLASSRFPFREKRRYAGTDTRIWIRHVRAQHNWPNLEYMAWDCKERQDYNDDDRIEDYEEPHWWTVNPYWNPDHEWKK